MGTRWTQVQVSTWSCMQALSCAHWFVGTSVHADPADPAESVCGHRRWPADHAEPATHTRAHVCSNACINLAISQSHVHPPFCTHLTSNRGSSAHPCIAMPGRACIYACTLQGQTRHPWTYGAPSHLTSAAAVLLYCTTVVISPAAPRALDIVVAFTP